jgi:hypothetical protein
MNSTKTIFSAGSRQSRFQPPLQPPSHTPSRPLRRHASLLALICLMITGFSLIAAPGVSWANRGTVPPPPPEQATILVGPVTIGASGLDSLTVAGVPIITSADTRIDERVAPLTTPGIWARVIGAGDGNGNLAALRIKVLPALPLVKLRGPLDALDNMQIVVDGIPINRTVTTLIIGNPQPGVDQVAVRAAIGTDNVMLALQVVKLNPIPDDPDDDDDDDDRPSETHLTGMITALPPNSLLGEWLVSGIPVSVGVETKLRAQVGLLAPGSWVKVKGVMQAGVLVAREVRTTHTHNFLKLHGTLTSLTPPENGVAGEVVVDEIPLDLSATASIRGNPQPGRRVLVKGVLSTDDTFLAVYVQGRGGGGNGPSNPPGLVIRFTGEVTALPADGLYGDWTIAGRTVTVPEGAFIDEHKGAVSVGAFVHVTAMLGPNESLTGLLIVVTRTGEDDDDDDDQREWIEFRGSIGSLPAEPNLLGSWVVGEKNVLVEPQTELEGDLQAFAEGKTVKVKGWKQADGSIRAVKIELREEQAQPVHFVGILEELPAGDTLLGTWLVDDREVTVTDSTTLETQHGDFVVGGRVKVMGQSQGGVITATLIKALPQPEIQYVGRIHSLPAELVGEWEIGEKRVTATAETEFKQQNGDFAVGLLVKVKGRLAGDGQIVALKIETLPLPLIEFVGEIRELPDGGSLLGLWQIGDYAFEVTDQTELRDNGEAFAEGMVVKAKGRYRADGVVIAEKIERHRHHDD